MRDKINLIIKSAFYLLSRSGERYSYLYNLVYSLLLKLQQQTIQPFIYYDLVLLQQKQIYFFARPRERAKRVLINNILLLSVRQDKRFYTMFGSTFLKGCLVKLNNNIHLLFFNRFRGGN